MSDTLPRADPVGGGGGGKMGFAASFGGGIAGGGGGAADISEEREGGEKEGKGKGKRGNTTEKKRRKHRRRFERKWKQTKPADHQRIKSKGCAEAESEEKKRGTVGNLNGDPMKQQGTKELTSLN